MMQRKSIKEIGLALLAIGFMLATVMPAFAGSQGSATPRALAPVPPAAPDAAGRAAR